MLVVMPESIPPPMREVKPEASDDDRDNPSWLIFRPFARTASAIRPSPLFPTGYPPRLAGRGLSVQPSLPPLQIVFLLCDAVTGVLINNTSDVIRRDLIYRPPGLSRSRSLLGSR